MSQAARLAHARHNDPLGLALLGAAALHAVFILGVGFDFQQGKQLTPERTLDVTLVRTRPKPDEPVDPEFLSQVSQQGGGEMAPDERPAAPPSPPAVEPRPMAAREIPRAGVPEPRPERTKPVLTATRATRSESPQEPAVPVQAPTRPDVAQLLASTQQEIDRLTSELDRRTVTASRARTKYVNASTQEYRYAAYIAAWREKVERIGNLNYPDEAKRQKLYGNLLLDVAVLPDGSLAEVRVVSSSGHKILDDAAVRIVKLAAPFAPFPDDIRADVDVLHITRTWQFLSGNRLFSR